MRKPVVSIGALAAFATMTSSLWFSSARLASANEYYAQKTGLGCSSCHLSDRQPAKASLNDTGLKFSDCHVDQRCIDSVKSSLAYQSGPTSVPGASPYSSATPQFDPNAPPPAYPAAPAYPTAPSYPPAPNYPTAPAYPAAPSYPVAQPAYPQPATPSYPTPSYPTPSYPQPPAYPSTPSFPPAPFPAPPAVRMRMAKFEDNCSIGDSYYVIHLGGDPSRILRFVLKNNHKVHIELPDASAYSLTCGQFPGPNSDFHTVVYE